MNIAAVDVALLYLNGSDQEYVLLKLFVILCLELRLQPIAKRDIGFAEKMFHLRI